MSLSTYIKYSVYLPLTILSFSVYADRLECYGECSNYESTEFPEVIIPENGIVSIGGENDGMGDGENLPTVIMSEEEQKELYEYMERVEENMRNRALENKDGLEMGMMSPIGSDLRVRNYAKEYPASAIVFITFEKNGKEYRCSGSMYSNNDVVTAGHCLHSDGAFHKNVKVWPSYDTPTSPPHGVFPAVSVSVHPNWTTSKNEEYDYGAIKLGSKIGDTTGWFSLQIIKDTDKPAAAISGYPGDKCPYGSMWSSVDVLRSVTARQLFYKNDTYDGMSGSPIWQKVPGTENAVIYGIHTTGLHGSAPHSDHNHGTRLTSDVVTNLLNWSNL